MHEIYFVSLRSFSSNSSESKFHPLLLTIITCAIKTVGLKVSKQSMVRLSLSITVGLWLLTTFLDLLSDALGDSLNPHTVFFSLHTFEPKLFSNPGGGSM
ncbi:unnamed protein product [Cuscuta europaea]|uniref:Uncharacterized protein n=1 Tax=Cuscuta europaea TaxID=41803 RepID=A0A9P0VN11_CUSEU|nr:unnamed protein product [Cuscuta europaea]